MLARMGRFAHTRWARMSSGRYCLIRDLGLVKGGKGLRHHEVVLTLSWYGVFRFLIAVARQMRWWEACRGRLGMSRHRVARESSRSSDEGLHQPDVLA